MEYQIIMETSFIFKIQEPRNNVYTIGKSCNLILARKVLRLFVMKPFTEISKGKKCTGKDLNFG